MSPIAPCERNPSTFRLRVSDVRRLHEVLEGDPATEQAILIYIQDIYGAKDLFELRPQIATTILQKPDKFIVTAIQHCQPALLLLVALAFLVSGCASLNDAWLSAREKHAVAAALASMNPRTTAQPPITLTTKFAGVCPYCNEINLSTSTANAGGASVSSVPLVPMPHNAANTWTNGTIQQWTIGFRCRNCLMPFSDYRDQFVPETRSVQLPIFGESTTTKERNR